MKFLEFLKIPLVKIIATIVILYFGLFYNKSDPASLGSRLSSQNIKRNLNEIQEQGKFIAVNITAAKELHKKKSEELNSAKINDIATQENAPEGDLDNEVSACSDEVEIAYKLFDSSNKLIESSEHQMVIIGRKKSWPLEKNIIGMKIGQSKTIEISDDLKKSDKKLSSLATSSGSLKYQVQILNLRKEFDPLATCE